MVVARDARGLRALFEKKKSGHASQRYLSFSLEFGFRNRRKSISRKDTKRAKFGKEILLCVFVPSVQVKRCFARQIFLESFCSTFVS
jgi:hypothetical protein